ncbi:MAG: hypothetical protein GY832_10855 [Chloroflexi bacterium]|nr:hypothetical protein [Chloroflexota bacterium]
MTWDSSLSAAAAAVAAAAPAAALVAAFLRAAAVAALLRAAAPLCAAVGVERVGFSGLVVLVGLVVFVGFDGFLTLGGVGLLAEVGEGFAVGLFLLGVTFFLTGFEDMDDFLGDFFFIFQLLILVYRRLPESLIARIIGAHSVL